MDRETGEQFAVNFFNQARCEGPVTSNNLLADIERMNLREIDDFLGDVVRIRGRKVAPILPRKEASLLREINQPFLENDQIEYDALVEMRRAENLIEEDHARLLKLTTKRESWEASRLEKLASLARLRGLTLREIMIQLGIQAANPSA